MKILVLYTRLTGYWMACMRHDYKINGNTYRVFRAPPSKDAPFKIESEAGIEVLDFNSDDIDDFQIKIKTYKADLVYLAGWTNRHYLNIAKHYKALGVPVITGMDNHWLGNMRQYMATILSRWIIRKPFTHIWVPGKPQYYYARKLGFRPEQILTGMYCADETLFHSISQTKHHKQLTFVGRIVDHKGVKEFFDAVNELIVADEFDLNIHIIGSGPLEHLIPKHTNIKHSPFVEVEKIPSLLKNAGTFILPSLYEAWGVVVHEAALAGLPIITTNQCGAGTDFVIEDFNGYKYDAWDKSKLKMIIKKVSAQNSEDYMRMSSNSKHLGRKINQEEWAAKLNSLKPSVLI